MSLPLPIPLTRFVGRARELNELRGLVVVRSIDHAHRSRRQRQDPARAATRIRASFPVYWIDLSTVIDPDQVVATIRHALGLGEHPDRSTRDLVIDFLRDRSALLVFDNCEQVSVAVAGLAQTVIDQCGDVTIVATSQQPLGLPREKVYAVPPLSVASGEGNPMPFNSSLIAPAKCCPRLKLPPTTSR